MRILIISSLVAVFAASVAPAEMHGDKMRPAGDRINGRLLLESMYRTEHAAAAVFSGMKGGSISITTVYSTKTTEDDSTRTISCHGDTEDEAILCSEELLVIIEETMEDPDNWVCDSVPTGAECSHTPH